MLPDLCCFFSIATHDKGHNTASSLLPCLPPPWTCSSLVLFFVSLGVTSSARGERHLLQILCQILMYVAPCMPRELLMCQSMMLYEDASQVATDAISGIRTLASFSAEKRVMTTYDHKCEASKNQGIRTGMVGGLGFGFSFLLLYLTYGLFFYVGAHFMHKGKTSFEDLFNVFFAPVLATIAISRTSSMAADSTKAKD